MKYDIEIGTYQHLDGQDLKCGFRLSYRKPGDSTDFEFTKGFWFTREEARAQAKSELPNFARYIESRHLLVSADATEPIEWVLHYVET